MKIWRACPGLNAKSVQHTALLIVEVVDPFEILPTVDREKPEPIPKCSPSQSLLEPIVPPLHLCDRIQFFLRAKYIEKAFLYQKYVLERLPAEEIAKEIGSARTTVLKYLKRHGIPIRRENSRGQSRAYGKRMFKRKAVPNEQELLTIKKMRSLRDQGYSYWKIAEILTVMKIPTKTRRSGWKAATVMKILKAI